MDPTSPPGSPSQPPSAPTPDSGGASGEISPVSVSTEAPVTERERSAQPASPSSPPLSAARRRDRLIGLFIVAAAFALCLILSIWAKEQSRPETSEPPGPPTVEGVIGFPSEVDPVATLAQARKLSRRSILRGIVMEGVQSDGTVDVAEGPGRVRYSFQSPAGHGPQPAREPGTLPKRLTCGKQNVLLRKEGLVAEPDLTDYPCSGLAIEPLPDPQCSARDIWRLARKRRVPKDRLAHIEYYRSKVGPAWRFEISGTTHAFSVYGDCKRELSAAEAYGSVP